MQLKRQFERRGPLWVPNYKVDPERLRYERYKKRFSPKLGFAHIQGQSSLPASGTTGSVVLGAAPTLGNLVCVAMCPGNAVTALTVKDSNNNVYTVTSGSPSANISGTGQTWLAYLLSAPSNATATITASWTTAANTAMFADEFSVSGGTASFDKDAAATATVGTTINTPSITPAGAGELLYAASSAGGTISAVGSPWTQTAGIVRNGDWAEYDLSASSITNVNFTEDSTGWSAMAMAFIFTAGGSFSGDEDYWATFKSAVPDTIVTVF